VELQDDGRFQGDDSRGMIDQRHKSSNVTPSGNTVLEGDAAYIHYFVHEDTAMARRRQIAAGIGWERGRYGATNRIRRDMGGTRRYFQGSVTRRTVALRHMSSVADS
jgi:hypothetical protein